MSASTKRVNHTVLTGLPTPCGPHRCPMLSLGVGGQACVSLNVCFCVVYVCIIGTLLTLLSKSCPLMQTLGIPKAKHAYMSEEMTKTQMILGNMVVS